MIKNIIAYFIQFHSNYLNKKGYIVYSLFLFVLILTNYNIGLEDDIIDRIYPAFLRIPAFFLLNSVAYFGALLILKFFTKNDFEIRVQSILYAALGLLILSVDRSVFSHLVSPILKSVNQLEYLFWFKTLFNAYGWFTVFGVLIICKLLFDKKKEIGIYGLNFKNINYRFYLFCLIIVVPLAAIASFDNEFKSFYPAYKRSGGAAFSDFYNISEIWAVGIYEFFYLTDFLNTELLFRGFLVIGISKYFGKNTILPMVAVYAVVHFGKPIGETVSSVFGGYFLGVLAFYSRNIWGGVFIHISLAGCMELFAFLNR